MNFIFSWQEQYHTRSLRSLVRYCCCHSNIKFLSYRHRVISSIYGLSQLISELTRITPTSTTLIDLCITSSHLGISDHSLVFMTLKICYGRTGSHRTIETRATTTTTSSTMLHNSPGIKLFQSQIRKRCGMFGKNYLLFK